MSNLLTPEQIAKLRYICIIGSTSVPNAELIMKAAVVLEELQEIVRELAKTNPTAGWSGCYFCSEDPEYEEDEDDITHTDDCPWFRATQMLKVVDEQQ